MIIEPVQQTAESLGWGTKIRNTVSGGESIQFPYQGTPGMLQRQMNELMVNIPFTVELDREKELATVKPA